MLFLVLTCYYSWIHLVFDFVASLLFLNFNLSFLLDFFTQELTGVDCFIQSPPACGNVWLWWRNHSEV